MNKERVREIARMGAAASIVAGTSHRWKAGEEAAREAGRKGAQARLRKLRKVA